MNKRIRIWLRARWSYLVFASVLLLVSVLALCSANGFVWLYIGLFAAFVFAFRPGSALHKATMEKITWLRTLGIVLAAAGTVAACVLPMGQLPLWNGENPEHRNQYELMAEALLDGRVHLVYGDEEELAQLSNPYDPAEREKSGVEYQWDHAFYDGHYYMYFGIVPVLLVFLPYRVLTGTALTTYHATQLFAALAIVGLFVLFRLLVKLFFKQLPYSVYVALAVAFSVMSVWYSTAEPALYCTAITSAMTLEIWSLYFFIRAVWGEQRENRQVGLAAVGAVLGALAFGCRPSTALANVLVVPMLYVFLRQRPCTLRLVGKLLLAALPYAVVGIGLMWYNYIRFDNVFEFGQAYQLTAADQSGYGLSLDAATLLRVVNNAAKHFFQVGELGTIFPYLHFGSVVWNFPILLLLGVGLAKAPVRNTLRDKGVLPLSVGVLWAALLIVAVSILWTPFLLERYRMDVYYLLSIGCFIAIGAWYTVGTARQRARLRTATVVLSAVTVVTAFLLCVRVVEVYYPEEVRALAEMLHLP